MKKGISEKELFETIPVPRAVATLASPDTYGYGESYLIWVSYFSWKTALIMSACFIICFAVLAPQILHLFIPAADTLHFLSDRKRSTLVTFASGSRMRIMICPSA